MTPPVSGGVPEQGLREVLQRIQRTGSDDQGHWCTGCRAFKNMMLEALVHDADCAWAIIDAALARPRPALPPDWKDTARAVFDALCAAHHPTSCRKYADDSATCTCGRDAAFKAWEVTAELQNDYELENE